MKKYAVIGNPIEHSLSPAMHNAAFKKLGVSAGYEPLKVERLDQASYDFLKKNYAGINVTTPHKVAIMEFIDEKEMAADLIGAVNCVSFGEGEGGKGKDPKAIGYNTDMYGAVEALKTEIPKLKGKKVLVLGAGGAARAIIYGCLLEGCKVLVYNRTAEKADELAEELEKKISKKIKVLDEINFGDIERDGIDAIINATSVGMAPRVDETPLTSGIPSNAVGRNLVVMDIVYNPLETLFLRQAKKAGARTINGVEMFVRQGAESLRIWGYEPPVDVMRKAVLSGLKK